VIVVTTRSLRAEATTTDTSETRQIHVSAMRDQSPIAIFTIAFSWDMHDSGTDDPRGVVLVKDQGIPAGVRVLPECKAVIDVLLGLDEVAFVILPPSHSSTMLDVGRLSLANQDAIMLRVTATLRDFNISVVNRTP
jgi:hypothetical protein